MRSRPCRHFCYSGMIGMLSPHRREDSFPLLAAPYATTTSIDTNNGQRPLGDWVRTMFKRTTEHELFLLLAMYTKVAISGMPHNISDLALEGAFIAKLFLPLSTVLFFSFSKPQFCSYCCFVPSVPRFPWREAVDLLMARPHSLLPR
jgi:hypothetical protein